MGAAHSETKPNQTTEPTQKIKYFKNLNQEGRVKVLKPQGAKFISSLLAQMLADKIEQCDTLDLRKIQ